MSRIKNYYFDKINNEDEYPDDVDSDYVECEWSLENDVIEYNRDRAMFDTDEEFWIWFRAKHNKQ